MKAVSQPFMTTYIVTEETVLYKINLQNKTQATTKSDFPTTANAPALDFF